MTTTLTPLSPAHVAERLTSGRAVLVDIREPDEFARAHVKGALSRPVSGFDPAQLNVGADRDIVFTCKSGMRTNANCERLAAGLGREAFMLDGGLDAWAKAGLPVETDAHAPLEMFRQVQIGAGSLVLIGTILGLAVHPGFFAIPAFVGAGLTVAGITGFCGMARVLALAPWNRPRAA